MAVLATEKGVPQGLALRGLGALCDALVLNLRSAQPGTRTLSSLLSIAGARNKTLTTAELAHLHALRLSQALDIVPEEALTRLGHGCYRVVACMAEIGL